jgi:hypothetical protein
MSVFLFLLGGWIVIGAFGLGIWSPIGPAAGFFPLAGGLLLAVLSLASLSRAARGLDVPTGKTALRDIAPIASVVVLAAAFLGAVEFVGMFASLPFFLVLLSLCVQWRTDARWLASISAGAVVFSVICYFVFKQFLGMLVPAGPLGF